MKDRRPFPTFGRPLKPRTTPADTRVHNHPPYRPACNERTVNGQLRGACLNDNGTDASEGKTNQ